MEGVGKMALNPQEAFRRGQERFLRRVIELEGIVDAVIDEEAYNAANSASKTIFVRLFLREFPRDVKVEVKKRFENAGWVVDDSQADWKLRSEPER